MSFGCVHCFPLVDNEDTEGNFSNSLPLLLAMFSAVKCFLLALLLSVPCVLLRLCIMGLLSGIELVLCKSTAICCSIFLFIRCISTDDESSRSIAALRG